MIYPMKQRSMKLNFIMNIILIKFIYLFVIDKS